MKKNIGWLQNERYYIATDYTTRFYEKTSMKILFKTFDEYKDMEEVKIVPKVILLRYPIFQKAKEL